MSVDVPTEIRSGYLFVKSHKHSASEASCLVYLSSTSHKCSAAEASCLVCLSSTSHKCSACEVSCLLYMWITQPLSRLQTINNSQFGCSCLPCPFHILKVSFGAVCSDSVFGDFCGRSNVKNAAYFCAFIEFVCKIFGYRNLVYRECGRFLNSYPDSHEHTKRSRLFKPHFSKLFGPSGGDGPYRVTALLDAICMS